MPRMSNPANISHNISRYRRQSHRCRRRHRRHRCYSCRLSREWRRILLQSQLLQAKQASCLGMMPAAGLCPLQSSGMPQMVLPEKPTAMAAAAAMSATKTAGSKRHKAAGMGRWDGVGWDGSGWSAARERSRGRSPTPLQASMWC